MCPGIQKSYLENRASMSKLFKLKNSFFSTQISGFPCSVNPGADGSHFRLEVKKIQTSLSSSELM